MTPTEIINLIRTFIYHHQFNRNRTAALGTRGAKKIERSARAVQEWLSVSASFSRNARDRNYSIQLFRLHFTEYQRIPRPAN